MAKSSLRFPVDSADVAAATTVPPPPTPTKRAKETSERTGQTTGQPATLYELVGPHRWFGNV